MVIVTELMAKTQVKTQRRLFDGWFVAKVDGERLSRILPKLITTVAITHDKYATEGIAANIDGSSTVSSSMVSSRRGLMVKALHL
ncbi:hypothetical protein TIFTF001_019091 [Ficus carica]|uniref:Uncharacterized protein n=1 Tax=Ficus carica TaxID=3494 RepID=A0AA88DJC4_FICCA|nr:hypothetical protein TIFTF001_019091 [Ficus carica]